MREDQIVRHWQIIRSLEKLIEGMTVSEIAEELECSERTVYRDLFALERGGFPLTSIKRNNETRYSFISGYKNGACLELANDELLALHLSRGLLKILDGSVFHSSLERLLAKVTAKVPEERRDHFDKLSEAVAIGKTTPRRYGEKQEIIQTIVRALRSRTTLRIRYFTPSSGQVQEREVDPYKLWFTNDAYYLIAWCHLRKTERTFLLDRIEDVQETEQTFELADDFDFTAYQKGAFRVIRDGRTEKVVIHFSAQVAHCFREKKWHQSQSVEFHPDGSARVTIEAEGMDEIASWVLSWGEHARVIAPESLQVRMRETSHRLLAAYG